PGRHAGLPPGAGGLPGGLLPPAAAACLLAALVLGGGWLGADGQARASFLRWARQVYETQIVFRFTGEAAEGGVYRAGWVPEGYTVWKVLDSSIGYTNQNGDILSFSYGPMQEGAGFAVTDTDKTIVKQVDIAGIPGELYLSTDPALSNVLIWLDEECGMHFGITGFLDESDMLHMAESVYLEESTK
ncbi:DUF4367 domain-containing protein, partial [uncultured Dysosmobacter sp.]|uniref:DUF4367 domain-containing protein n=1 Tax=uncultured Dysosmobacter sp. TaxID=2591384 RepID=UPI0026248B7F